MIFFDKFIEKIEKADVFTTGNHTFTLEFKKKIVWLSTGIPLFLMGAFQGYLGYSNGMKISYFIFAVILLGLSLYHFKMAFSYKIVLDFDHMTLKNNKLLLKLDEIDSITLKRMVAPGSKKLQACIDIITTDKKEIIIPLIMTNKINFAALLRTHLKDKFNIIKD